MIRLRTSEAYFRLLSTNQDTGVDQCFVPWQSFSTDARAKFVVPLAVGVIRQYGKNFKKMNSNCLVLWHNIFIMLTANMKIFDLGAGRGGPEKGRKALAEIALWSKTPAARRACVHAGQTLKLSANRRASDGIMFHAATSLFISALVLGLYVFQVPEVPKQEGNINQSLDLLGDVNWEAVGNEGLVDMDPNSPIPNDPVARFIRYGGTISLFGSTTQSGYQSARRILLDYVSVLEEMEKWKVGQYSHILRIMSDTLG